MNSHIPSVKSFSDCTYVLGARAARYGGRNIYFFYFSKMYQLVFLLQSDSSIMFL